MRRCTTALLLRLPSLFLLLLLFLPNQADTSTTTTTSLSTKVDSIERVHLVFTHHLDVGLDVLPGKIVDNCVGFATSIIRRYFQEHIPRALELAKNSRAYSKEDPSIHRFVYSVHPWIANLYVDCVPWTVADGCEHPNISTIVCPTKEEVDRFDEGVLAGDIVWSHSPFNINPEAVGEPSFFADLAEIAGSLDNRYNRSTKGRRVWTNVDVKGFARSAIPLLKRAGFQALYVGQNGHPTAPASARVDKGLQPVVGDANATIFEWKDPVSGMSIPVLYSDGYGGFETSDQCIQRGTVALCSYFRKDNEGPPDSLDEIDLVFSVVQRNFPQAAVLASSFEAFATEALEDVTAAAPLPSTTLDWGDQWLTGVSTDPYRLAVFREMTRARAACINLGTCDPNSPVMRNFTRFLCKNVEHTQGVQGEDWSPGIAGPLQKEIADTSHWSNAEFEKVHGEAYNKFFMGDYSWLENRKFNDLALEALERAEHPLAAEIRERLEKLVPRRPNLTALTRTTDRTIRCEACGVDFDVADDGSIEGLTTPSIALSSLFQVRYVTYNKTSETWDGRKNMTCDEPGCANPESRVWSPTLRGIWQNCSDAADAVATTRSSSSSSSACTVVARSTFDVVLHEKYGAPLEVFVTYVLIPQQNKADYEDSDSDSDVDRTVVVDVTVEWFNKSTTRLPESLTVSFRPSVSSSSFGRWRTDVLGSFVGVDEVAVFGTTNPYQRATWTGVDWTPENGTGFVLESLDAALACPILDGNSLVLGGSTPMGEGTQPQHRALNVTGMAYSLLHNLMPISGFPQWYPFGVGDTYQTADEASKFRFSLRVPA